MEMIAIWQIRGVVIKAANWEMIHEPIHVKEELYKQNHRKGVINTANWEMKYKATYMGDRNIRDSQQGVGGRPEEKLQNTVHSPYSQEGYQGGS